MVFKQGVLKEKKDITISLSIVFVWVWLALVLVILYKEENPMIPIVAWSLFWLPFDLILIFGQLHECEWHCVYDDRIETRCIYGIKNTVHFENVLLIEELPISITTRGKDYAFYIFNDGRKNNGNFLDCNSCYNRKKYNLRIYKTPELEEFIKKHPVLKNLPMKKSKYLN